jgi:hypothetical protein
MNMKAQSIRTHGTHKGSAKGTFIAMNDYIKNTDFKQMA